MPRILYILYRRIAVIINIYLVYIVYLSGKSAVIISNAFSVIVFQRTINACTHNNYNCDDNITSSASHINAAYLIIIIIFHSRAEVVQVDGEVKWAARRSGPSERKEIRRDRARETSGRSRAPHANAAAADRK